MQFNDKHILIDGTLANKDEANAYVKFLESEQERHLMDVQEITKRIDEIEERWGL